MFRSDEQIRAVADALCRRAQLPTWWGDRDVDGAVEWLESGAGRTSQRALVGVAFMCWNGGNGGEVPIGALAQLDNSNMAAVGRLLVAIVEGADALDAWLSSEASDE
jgi:hypothetical protein